MQDVPLITSAANQNDTANALLGGSTSGGYDTDAFQTLLDHQSALSRESRDGGTFAPAPTLENVFRDARTAKSERDAAGSRAETEGKEPELDDMKDVPVDSESFQAMKPQLEKYGLSKEDIRELEERVESKEGMTWGQFVNALSDKMSGLRRTIEFSAGQRQKMMTMFQKLGFSASESKNMVGELAQGNVGKVLDALGRQIESLPQDKLMSLDKDELKTFMAELQKLKGEMEGKELGLVRVVGRTMQDALAAARDKALQVANAKDGAEARAGGLNDAHGKGAKDAAPLRAAETAMNAAEAARKNARTDAELRRALDADEQLKGHAGKIEDSIREGLRLNENRNADQFARQEAKSDEKNAWTEFMGKLRRERTDLPGARTTTQNAQTALADAVNQTRGETTAAPRTTQQSAAPRLLNQVQDAALRSMANGGKRLTIQLNPQELGTLSVALTVKNKEVQAMIRTDNHETAKLVNGHLEALRQSLEEQGLKVTKMEVQTQLSGQDGRQWLGEQGHNQAQDEHNRRQVQQRMRAMRGEAGASAEDVAANVRQAILSGNGLHVIA